MSIQTVVSRNNDPGACARELRRDLGALTPAFVVFFATAALNAEQLGAALAREFPGVPSLGCTTAGELTSGRMLKDSVVLMAMSRASVEHAHVRALPDLREPAAIRQAILGLSEEVGQPLAQLSPERFVGLVLHDGLSAAEERVMSQICQLTNVPFVGGSAGDDLKFRQTTVFVNFRPVPGQSAVCLLKPVRPFGILKTQSFAVLDQVLTATEVDDRTRTVKRFNGRPAAEEYAARLGISVADAPKYFRSHPVGIVMSDGEPFVRGLRRLVGTDIAFYCEIPEGANVNLLEARDIVERTGKDLSASVARLGGCAGIIDFDCVQRTLELTHQGRSEEYAALFSAIPTVGFSTYGESYIGHINQTATMLLMS